MSDKCVSCGEDTSFGSGRFVNRLPADDSYICADCLIIECDNCGEGIELDGDIKVGNAVYCYDCVTTKWKALAMMIWSAADNEDLDLEERIALLADSAKKLVGLTEV